MRILAIETSLAPGSVALGDENGIELRLAPEAGRDFATWLTPALVSALRAADDGEPPAGIAVALGPGSFTGLRVGLAAAKGLCLARDLPLLGVPTADLIAQETPVHDTPLFVVVPFNPREVYLSRYRTESGAWRAEGAAELAPVAHFLGCLPAPAVVAGPLLPPHAGEISRVYGASVFVYDHLRPDSPALCRLACEMLRRGETLPVPEAVPLYVSDATPVRRARGEAI